MKLFVYFQKEKNLFVNFMILLKFEFSIEITIFAFSL
jgi:hypothetical protein